MATRNLLLLNLKTDADDDVLGFTTDWVNAMARLYDQVFVITMAAGRLAVAPNVEVYSVGKEKGYSEPRRVLEFYRVLGGLMKRHRLHACFAHMSPEFAILAAPLLRARGVPIVLWYTHKAVTWRLRMATGLVDRVVTASAESFRLETPKVRVVGHGIDTDKFLPAEPAADAPTFRILSVGRLSAIKRIDLLVEAAALLKAQRPDLNFRVRFVGKALSEEDHRYVAELERRVAELELGEVVEFAGSVPFQEVPRQYQVADATVNLCPTGGVDKAVLEAMSAGVPVVVANRTFGPILGEGLGDTYVVPAEPAAIADRLAALSAMRPDERRALGQVLRSRIETGHRLEHLCGRISAELTELAR